MRRLIPALVAVAIAAAGTRARAQPVAVVPADPSVDAAAVDRGLAQHGIATAGTADLTAELRAAAERVRTADSALAARVDAALGRARTAYLEQRWSDALAALDALEREALPLLARPDRRALAWQVALQRGVTQLGRGDAGAARERFALALAIQPDKRPARELWGPDVVSAFAEAAAARAQTAARPVALAITPVGARVAVDGVPVVAPSRPLALTPGLHLVYVDAPGYATAARIVRIGPTDRVTVSLAPAAPIDGLARRWTDGALAGDDAPERNALLAAAHARGAARVLVVRGGAHAAARLVTADGAGPWTAGSDTDAAALAVMAPPIAPAPAPTSITHRWWFWTGVSAVVLAAGGTALALALRDSGTRCCRVFAGAP